jgi:hypothetical protein
LRSQRWRRDFGGRCRQGRSGHYVPPIEGGVAAAESSKLSWTSVFTAFMGIVVSCVSVRRPTLPTVWRRGPLLQMCLPKSRDFGRSMLTPSGKSRLRIASAASWRRRWPPWRARGRTSGAAGGGEEGGQLGHRQGAGGGQIGAGGGESCQPAHRGVGGAVQRFAGPHGEGRGLYTLRS